MKKAEKIGKNIANVRKKQYLCSMIATREYIQRKFDEYNALCFEGKLAPLPIRLNRSRRTLGMIRYSKRPKGLFRSGWEYYDFTFCISTLIDRPEEVVEDTILHEMIHYYILSNQLQDTSAHGELFRRMMTHINRTYHRHISITHRSTQTELEADTQVRQHILCVSRMQDGMVGLTIVMPSRYGWMKRNMPLFPGLVEQRWYVSKDSFFNRYPRSKTCKMYRIDAQLLEPHLATAVSLA